MKIKILDKNLKETEKTLDLNKKVWEKKLNSDLVAQVVTVFRSNQRSSNASTKNRGEVRGGGIKPWKQKGTGRARHGSRRSPIWTGGGVTFGSTGRNWDRKVNRKMRLGALACVLSDKLKNERIYFLNGVDINKSIVENPRKVLVVTNNDKVLKKIRNVEKLEVHEGSNLNVLDVLSADKVFFDVDCVDNLESRYK